MFGTSQVIAFVPARSLERARAFYADTLGLTLTSQDDFGLMFDAAGTPLRVARVDDLTPAGFTIVGWLVSDIGAAVAQLARRGVTMERFEFMAQDEQGVWIAPGGARVAWFKDPDGNTLSITQRT